jgi:hypothetical protein
MNSLPVVVTNFAQDFAKALARGDFKSAYEMQSNKLKSSVTENNLKTSYDEMTSYADDESDDGQGAVAHAIQIPETSVDNTMTEWPNKLKDDLGWVYVSITADNFNEAVSVVVSKENGNFVIREVEWGRP